METQTKTCEGGTSLWNCGRPAGHSGPCQPLPCDDEKPAINFDNVKVWPANTWFQRRLKEVRSR